MPINSFLYPATQVVSGYEVANSLRFNDGSSDYLNRTQGTPTNADKYTLSVWVKRCGLTTSDYHYIASFDGGSNPREHIRFNDTTDQLTWYFRDSGGTATSLTTNRLFRDVSAWYHIVCSYDSTQSTSSNRQKIYINGVQETSFSSSGYVAQNTDANLNTNSNNIKIGALGVSSPSAGFFDGYMAEYVFIDGQALDPTSFGEFDEDSGIWKPIDVSGLTFGTNGFYLDFENSGSLGADVSGNGNNFTVNNLTAIDQTTDTCTNNFVTLNPLAQTTTKGTVSQGNLEYDRQGSTANWVAIGSTIGVTTGKWYYEYKVIDAGTPNQGSQIGFVNYDVSNFQSDSSSDLSSTGEYSFYSGGGNIFANGSSLGTFEGGYADGDIIMVAIDLDNSYAYWGKNGSWINSGDPTSGSSGTGGFSITGVGTNIFAPAIAHREDGNGQANFGNPPFTISSGNADGDGYGNFEYAVPSGYYALNTKNLAEYG